MKPYESEYRLKIKEIDKKMDRDAYPTIVSEEIFDEDTGAPICQVDVVKLANAKLHFDAMVQLKEDLAHDEQISFIERDRLLIKATKLELNLAYRIFIAEHNFNTHQDRVDANVILEQCNDLRQSLGLRPNRRDDSNQEIKSITPDQLGKLIDQCFEMIKKANLLPFHVTVFTTDGVPLKGSLSTTITDPIGTTILNAMSVVADEAKRAVSAKQGQQTVGRYGYSLKQFAADIKDYAQRYNEAQKARESATNKQHHWQQQINGCCLRFSKNLLAQRQEYTPGISHTSPNRELAITLMSLHTAVESLIIYTLATAAMINPASRQLFDKIVCDLRSAIHHHGQMANAEVKQLLQETSSQIFTFEQYCQQNTVQANQPNNAEKPPV